VENSKGEPGRIATISTFHMASADIVEAQLVVDRLQELLKDRSVDYMRPGWQREFVQDGVRLYRIIQRCIQ